MTELEIEELESKVTENDSSKEEERSGDDTGSNFGEEVRHVLTPLEADEESGRVAILKKKRLPLLKK